MDARPLPHVDFDPQSLHTRLRIQLAGRLEAISPAVERMMAEVRAMECSRGKEFEIETALRETLANAVRHGCGNDATKKVEACVAGDESRRMLIVVRAPGPAMRPLVPAVVLALAAPLAP